MLKRLVVGPGGPREVELTAEEEADVRAIWATNDPATRPRKLPDLQPFQFWAMLDLSGYRDDLEAFVANLPGDQKIVAQAKLQHTLIFRRDNPLVEAARQGIGLTNEELDALWMAASQID